MVQQALPTASGLAGGQPSPLLEPTALFGNPIMTMAATLGAFANSRGGSTGTGSKKGPQGAGVATQPAFVPPGGKPDADAHAFEEMRTWQSKLLRDVAPRLLLRLVHHHLPGRAALALAFSNCEAGRCARWVRSGVEGAMSSSLARCRYVNAQARCACALRKGRAVSPDHREGGSVLSVPAVPSPAARLDTRRGSRSVLVLRARARLAAEPSCPPAPCSATHRFWAVVWSPETMLALPLETPGGPLQPTGPSGPSAPRLASSSCAAPPSRAASWDIQAAAVLPPFNMMPAPDAVAPMLPEPAAAQPLPPARAAPGHRAPLLAGPPMQAPCPLLPASVAGAAPGLPVPAGLAVPWLAPSACGPAALTGTHGSPLPLSLAMRQGMLASTFVALPQLLDPAVAAALPASGAAIPLPGTGTAPLCLGAGAGAAARPPGASGTAAAAAAGDAQAAAGTGGAAAAVDEPLAVEPQVATAATGKQAGATTPDQDTPEAKGVVAAAAQQQLEHAAGSAPAAGGVAAPPEQLRGSVAALEWLLDQEEAEASAPTASSAGAPAAGGALDAPPPGFCLRLPRLMAAQVWAAVAAGSATPASRKAALDGSAPASQNKGPRSKRGTPVRANRSPPSPGHGQGASPSGEGKRAAAAQAAGSPLERGSRSRAPPAWARDYHRTDGDCESPDSPTGSPTKRRRTAGDGGCGPRRRGGT
jgi:hypothetical protein